MSLIDDFKGIVSPFLNSIKEAFRAFIEKVKGIVETIIAKIVEFKTQIVDWFKQQKLKKGRDIPFLTTKQEFRDWIKNAPRKNIGLGLIEGVYDEQTDEITDLRYISADEYDEKTKEVLGNDELVVLT